MAMQSVTDETFEAEVLKADRPVLVDFWAEWCGPCKQIGPRLEELAGEFADRVRIVKLNVDDNPMTPSRFGVRGVPTLMLFKNGRLADTRMGDMPKSRLSEWLTQAAG